MLATRLEAAAAGRQATPPPPWDWVSHTTSVASARKAALALVAGAGDAPPESVVLVAAADALDWSDGVMRWAYSRRARRDVGCAVELFFYEETIKSFFDLAEEEYWLPHRVLDPATSRELDAFFASNGGPDRAARVAPVLLSSDAQARWIGARAGDFVACDRIADDGASADPYIMVVRDLDFAATAKLMRTQRLQDQEEEKADEEEEEEEEEEDEDEDDEEEHVREILLPHGDDDDDDDDDNDDNDAGADGETGMGGVQHTE